jgi:hypothetical protein
VTPTTTRRSSPKRSSAAIIGNCARQPGAVCEGDHHPEDLRKAIIGSCAGDEQLQELALRRVGVGEARCWLGPGARLT